MTPVSSPKLKTALDYALKSHGDEAKQTGALELLHAIVQTAWVQLTLTPKDAKTKAAETEAQSICFASILVLIEEQLGSIPGHMITPKSRTVLTSRLPTPPTTP